MKLIIALILCSTLTGCLTPEPQETKPEDAQSLVDSMVYVRAKNGICYGVATVLRMNTSGAVAENQMIVPADCALVK